MCRRATHRVRCRRGQVTEEELSECGRRRLCAMVVMGGVMVMRRSTVRRVRGVDVAWCVVCACAVW